MIRVYKFGLRWPSGEENLARIDAQLRAVHEYANNLVQIERARRGAVRACEQSPEVAAAEEALKQATRSTRKAAAKALQKARAEARAGNEKQLKAIAEKDHELRVGLRALTPTYWGTYLLAEASADQARKMPLYGDDGITPADPHFKRWRPGNGQLGIQIQKGVETPAAMAGENAYVQIVNTEKSKANPRGQVLRIRVGSDEKRGPIWAEWPIVLHRAIPDAATWKKVTVTSRQEGPAINKPRWTCEITLDIPMEHPHELDTFLDGAIAIEVAWDRPDDELAVAYWQDSRGGRGKIVMPHRLYRGVREIPDGIRSVRDQILNDFRPKFHAAMAAERLRDSDPTHALSILYAWTITCLLWRSPSRFHDLAARWRKEHPDAAPAAYTLLRAWEIRDIHLWQYETGARTQSLRTRLDWYRNLAAGWSRQYRTVILDDRDLSREARWGEASDLRFTASPFELRQCLKHSFGGCVYEHTYKQTEREKEEDDRSWCERALDAWNTEGARKSEIPRDSSKKAGGAWRQRKEKKLAKAAPTGPLANLDVTIQNDS
jgi:hypothetical protein